MPIPKEWDDFIAKNSARERPEGDGWLSISEYANITNTKPQTAKEKLRLGVIKGTLEKTKGYYAGGIKNFYRPKASA